MTLDRKRGRPRKRDAAKKAADALRRGEYDNIFDAGRAFYLEHYPKSRSVVIGLGDDRERFKEFIKYIVEELNSGPKSMHVYRVLRQRAFKRNEQASIKSRRHKELIAHIRSVLDTTGLFPPDNSTSSV